MIPPELLTGNDDIDEQHASLIAELALLKNVMGDGEPPPRTAILEFLQFLRNHFTTHFEMEERLMAEVAYPEWPTHAEEHKSFFDTFIHYKAKVQYGDDSGAAAVALVDVINAWVERHVKHSDARFAAYYRAEQERLSQKGL